MKFSLLTAFIALVSAEHLEAEKHKRNVPWEIASRTEKGNKHNHGKKDHSDHRRQVDVDSDDDDSHDNHGALAEADAYAPAPAKKAAAKKAPAKKAAAKKAPAKKTAAKKAPAKKGAAK